MRFIAAAVLLPSLAFAGVSNPFPGVKLVESGGSAMIIANLCAPGIKVRATKYDERRGTPQTWAGRVGVQAAINADFFDFPGWSLVNGRARGNGEDWPANKQYFESRSYWQFGLFNADLQQNAAVGPPPSPWATEIVGGHNILIRDGQSLGPSFDGDGVLTGGHRRTAIGLSKDRRTLFLFATNNSVTGTGIVSAMRALQAEGGGPAIDIATNVDGGGSSQMFVQGRGQVITSGREVNNHLGIYASGSGIAPNCNNIPPRGTLDAVSCDSIAGWAQDQNVDKSAIPVHVYFGGPAGSGAAGLPVTAGDKRADLCTPLGSCEHAFSFPPPLSFFDNKPHPIHAYAIDSEGGQNPELANSPKTLTCNRMPPAGVRRHIVNGDAYAAWNFSGLYDQQPLSDSAFAAIRKGPAFPAKPVMQRGEGLPEVYLIDSGIRRHVPNPEVAKWWHLDLATVKVVPKAEIEALPLGPPLRSRPWLIKATGPEVDLVDDDLSDLVAAMGRQVPGVAQVEPVAPTPTEVQKQGEMMKTEGGCSTAPGSLLALAVLGLLRRRRC